MDYARLYQKIPLVYHLAKNIILYPAWATSAKNESQAFQYLRELLLNRMTTMSHSLCENDIVHGIFEL